MTTVISIKAIDGIVLASESQGTLRKTKTEYQKLFNLNNQTCIGGASDSAQIEILVEGLKSYLPQMKFDSESKLRNQISTFLNGLNRDYNVLKPFMCGYNEPRPLFFPTALLAIKLRIINSVYIIWDLMK